jgi:NAD+ synthase (glutamine-hydrolysing)
VAGATVILNPSASNDLVGKAKYRRELVIQQSGRTLAAYAYANTGVHESTTDLVFGGHLLIAENGVLLAEGERFKRDGELVATDVDVERLRVERARQTSFADAVHGSVPAYRTVSLAPMPAAQPHRLVRRIEPHPFVPDEPQTLDERCREVFQVQTAGLARRLEHVGVKRVVLGLSGGLDSTLALLVCARTFDLLGLPRAGILAVTMPGFGTTARTLETARCLARGEGGHAARDRHPAGLRAAHPGHRSRSKDRESLTFQNLQARERTQLLMDLANKESGIVVGTSDLSELALGFATFAGDHIAMYGVNSSVPKTLVRQLVEWVAAHHASDGERKVLRRRPRHPRLARARRGGRRRRDLPEDGRRGGPYELVDFFLYWLLRFGAGPRKILFLAGHAFAGQYDAATLRKWLTLFVRRFFAQQWKRSVMPDGPKVGSVSLSPRGDWRMPSDATAAAWLREIEGGEPT